MRGLLALGAIWVFLVPAAAGAARPPVVVAIVDSGVQRGTPEVEERLVPGYNALDGSANTKDDFGHGTAVAYELGLSLGLSGVCQECRLMPVKIAGPSGNATSQAMAAGLRWATDHGARVINMSYGPVAFAPRDERVESAIADALARGVAVVLSAGNSGEADPAVNKHASDNPEAIAVAAVDSSNHLATRSNHGSWVAIAAQSDSTSIAAPQVAAAAAELFSWRPELTRDEVKGYLRSGCTPVTDLDVAWHCVVDQFRSLGAAGFDPERWASLDVSVGGDGRGTITAAGLSMDCTSVCLDRVPAGTKLTLTATPAADSTFTGWSGDCFAAGPTCTITAAAVGRTFVHASFTARRAALTVRAIGAGTVTSVPVGISCGKRCSALFTAGPVRLVAYPARGHRLVRWEGACGGTKPSCSLDLSRARTAIARFR
jgi:Subtilase family/Divergent InlB B-repeat domain